MSDATRLAEQCAELARLGVSTVYEGNGRTGLIDEELIQIIPGTRVAGPARTVLCAQNDNLMVHAALDGVRPGEVIVATMPQAVPVSLMGDLMVLQAHKRRVAGALLNAAVRDVDELRAIGVPIWSRFIRSRTAEKATPGALDVPIAIGGTTINPGDIVVMDADGAVAVRAERIDEVLKACHAREAKEVTTKAAIADGQLTYDLNDLRAIVEGKKP